MNSLLAKCLKFKYSLKRQVALIHIGRVCNENMSTEMKAVQVREFGSPDVLKITPSATYPELKSNELVLIKVYCAGVNPVDTYIRSGIYKVKPSLPYIPGSDGSGIVEKVLGSDSKFKVGDRVYFRSSLSGSYAQFTTVHQSNVFALNDRLTYQQGAAIGVPYFTAHRALVKKCSPVAGQTVLVHGASGAVGLAACQIGRYLGLKMYGTAGTEQGMKLVVEHGAEKAFNHTEAQYQKRIMEATDNLGVDIVLEMLADVNLEADLEMAAALGKIVIIGSRDTVQITPRHCMAKELTVLGVMMGKATQADIHESSAFFNQAQTAGSLMPHVGLQFTINEVVKAHDEVLAHTGGSRGKIVLNIDHSS